MDLLSKLELGQIHHCSSYHNYINITNRKQDSAYERSSIQVSDLENYHPENYKWYEWYLHLQ